MTWYRVKQCIWMLGLVAGLGSLKGVSAQPVATGKGLSQTPKAVIDGFMDKRFGMFIHWGPVALRGTEIGWSRNHQVAQADYDSLYREFNPVLFNAEAWVRTARDAGMKYLTITAKHHDGFCLWPSKYTQYNISQTPFKKDVVRMLADACKKYGVKFCIYYTVLDWYHPDYALHNDGKKEPDPKANMARFATYMKNQLQELITQYHPYMLWFDGNWDGPWTLNMAKDVYAWVKKLDPNVIVNNRLGKGSHKVMGPETVGDYATPEQEIGKINMQDPWESCITIAQQWAWKPNDKLKSITECIQTLSRTAAGNGNLLFNVGPMPDGRIEQRQVKLLQEMGQWLKVNGEAIYGTLGGPYKPDSAYAATRKGNKVYIHCYAAGGGYLEIPALPGRQVKAARFLAGGMVTVKETAQTIRLSWNGALPDPRTTVILLEMNGEVESVPIL